MNANAKAVARQVGSGLALGLRFALPAVLWAMGIIWSVELVRDWFWFSPYIFQSFYNEVSFTDPIYGPVREAQSWVFVQIYLFVKPIFTAIFLFLAYRLTPKDPSAWK